MNAITTLPNLPAHLQKLAQNTALTSAAFSAGISSGGVPHISIKASRFRLVSASGEELLINALNLDVIAVDANPHISKVFYAGAYDPNGEDLAPDCWSDNGVGPSSGCKSPQAKTCAVCPNNVWGSKISEASGKGVKACSDVKKVAVIMADNPDGPVYLLRIPPASLKNWAEYINALDKHSIPASIVVTRLSFDANASHPKLLFAPVFNADNTIAYINEAQAEAIESVIGTDEVDKPIGKLDKPLDATRQIAAPIAALPAPQAAITPPAAQIAPPPLPPMPPIAQPPAMAPVQPAALPPALPPVPPTAGTQPTAPRTRRKRGVKSEESVQGQQAAQPQLGLAPPPFVANMHGAQAVATQVAQQNPAAAITPLTPPVADSALSALLDAAMRT